MANVRTTMAIEEARIRTLERANRSKKQRFGAGEVGEGIGDRGRRNEKERERQRGERGSTWVERGEN